MRMAMSAHFGPYCRSLVFDPTAASCRAGLEGFHDSGGLLGRTARRSRLQRKPLHRLQKNSRRQVPRTVKLGTKSIGFVEGEIAAYNEARIAARDGAA